MFFRPLQSLCALLALVAVLPAFPALARDPDQIIRFSDLRGEVIEGGVWLPASGPDASPRALVVISHGNGGGYAGHDDTARALADAGFIVAALSHPGDNFRDQSRGLQLTGRAPQLSALIAHMVDDWRGPVLLDADRIGAFGFSAGGFTVTSIVGGVSELPAILDHCAAHPDLFACRLLAMGPPDPAQWHPESRDPRVKAAVIAAPGYGGSFTTDSLASITVPVQLWQAADDQILRSPYNVEPIRDRLGRAPEYHRVEGAGHFDFLPACAPQMRAAVPELCVSAPGFDRAAFKVEFNRQVVAFFHTALSAAP
jgi:predicted dienelactone hydrolase